VLPDDAQPVFGVKRCGVVSLTFGPGPVPEPQFREPDDIRHLVQNTDIPDFYHAR
jgi:hypothetical protein